MLAFGIATTWCVPGCAPSETPNERPNVVVIVHDTLRPDHLGSYGADREIAPYLASLAAQGSLFFRAHSTSSWTAPATASLFTGLYPTRHGVLEGMMAHRDRVEEVESTGHSTLKMASIPNDITTLPERFRAGGYRTFAIGTNPNLGVGIGFRRGFDKFVFMGRGYAGASQVVDQGRAWRDLLEDSKPYFLYLHLNDAHLPYHTRKRFVVDSPTSELDRQRIAYNSEISYADHHLGKLSELLNWDENTIVVAMSDHGEGFNDHGYMEHRDLNLYFEVNDILLLIRAPDQRVRNQTLHDNVSIVDLLPTLLELAGLPKNDETDGRSLVPLLQGGANEGRLRRELEARPLLAHRLEWASHRSLWAVIEGRWKLIVDPEDPHRGPKLYDRGDDPLEQHDRSSERVALVERLLARLYTFRQQSRKGTPLSVDIGADELQHLRELGYAE
jgi:arylsulfatase A-like enzyme